jgi:dephospho-CoA kinase
MTHPEIRKRVSAWALRVRSRAYPPPLAVVEVPLIFEGGYNQWFNGVLCLSTQRPNRLQRLVKRGWSVAEARRRERLQWPVRKREKYSDWVVRNNSGISSLRRGLVEWLDYLEREKSLERYQKYFGK